LLEACVCLAGEYPRPYNPQFAEKTNDPDAQGHRRLEHTEYAMAWNEPGGPKDNDPWGRPSNDQRPPDLDEVVRKLQEKLGGLFGGKSGGGAGGGRGGAPIKANSTALLAIGGLFVAVWAAFGIYIVAPAERGVAMRFGAHSDTTLPGLHWNWPYPIGAVIKLDVDQIRNQEIGFRTGGRGQSSIVPKLDEALMLTRDENIVDVKFEVQYRVKDAAAFLFKVSDPEETLKQVVESAVREVVGQSDMDFVITEGRSEIATRVSQLTQETLDRYGTGLQVTGINMQNAQPPEQVQDAFHDVVKAREDEQRLKNEAEAYANDIVPKARGQAARQIEEANAYRDRVIAQAEGEAARFVKVLDEYKKAPDVTRRRMYLDTMEEVLASTDKVIVDTQSNNNVMLLPLDRLMSGAGMSGGSAATPSMSAPGMTAPSAPTSGGERAANSGDALRSRERR
jgi:membrane protease subunit HflK